MKTIEFLVTELGKRYVLRIEKWKDEESWRVGLNWYDKDNFHYVCEKKTLREALQNAYDYVNLPDDCDDFIA